MRESRTPALSLRPHVGLVALAAVSACGCVGQRPLSYSQSVKVARYGVRAGGVRFMNSTEKEPDDRPLAGVYMRLKDSGPVLCELGLDVAPHAEDISDRQLYVARCNICYYPIKWKRWYVHLGGAGLYEKYLDDSYTAASLEAGTGVGFLASGIELDLRLSYVKILDSENSQEALMLALGFGF